MGRRLKIGLVSAVFFAALTLALARPWAEFSPLAMNSLFSADKRTENFRHLDRIFPSRSITAPSQSFQFERAERPLNPSYQFNGEKRDLNHFLDKVNSTGLLVVHRDQIIRESYANGANDNSLMTSWSVAKSFVGTLIGIAVSEGKIHSLDDPITQYLPELLGSGYEKVPIRHVLQMSSGVDFEEIYGDRFSDINKFFVHVFVLGKSADDVLASYGSSGPSGQTFKYISIDTHALGLLLRRVYDQPLTEILEQKLWQPLGMEADAYWNIDENSPAGAEIGFCCLNARIRDYAKLGRLYVNEGIWEQAGESRRILPAGWVQEATQPSAAHLEPAAIGDGIRGYQYQWWVPHHSDGDFFAAGIWGQHIYVSPQDDLVIVRTSVDPDYFANMAETIAVFRAIRQNIRANIATDK